MKLEQCFSPSLALFPILLCAVQLDSASAQNLITNGGFEDTSNSFVDNGQGVMSLSPGSTTIPGWTITDASILWVKNTNPFGPRTPYGSFFLDLTGFQDNTQFGGVTQRITTAGGEQYALTFGLGVDQDVAAYRGPVSAHAQAGSTASTFTFTPVFGSTGNQWGSFTLYFTAQSSFTDITIIGSQSTGGQYLGLDNVTVSAVPEPESSIAAVLLSVFAAGHEFRRRGCLRAACGWRTGIRSASHRW